MLINKYTYNYYTYGKYNNRLAVEINTYDFISKKRTYYIIVLKDISAKRYKLDNTFKKNPYNKILFMSNTQLMDVNNKFFEYSALELPRSIVFDDKLGTKYEYKASDISGYGDSYLGAIFHKNLSWIKNISCKPHKTYMFNSPT